VDRRALLALALLAVFPEQPSERSFVIGLRGLSSAASPRGDENPSSTIGEQDESSQTVGFGKYEDLTYDEVYALHPRYCKIVLEAFMESVTLTGPDAFADEPEKRAFADWIQRKQEMAPRAAGDTRVGFGQHKELTCKEVWVQHPDFCVDFILEEHKDPSMRSRPEVDAFADWLAQQGISEQVIQTACSTVAGSWTAMCATHASRHMVARRGS
jgi:hypothetical protein